MINPPKYIDSTMLAALVGVQQSLVSIWVQNGKVPKPRRSGRRLVHITDEVLQAVINNELTIADDKYDDIVEYVNGLTEKAA